MVKIHMLRGTKDAALRAGYDLNVLTGQTTPHLRSGSAWISVMMRSRLEGKEVSSGVLWLRGK